MGKINLSVRGGAWQGWRVILLGTVLAKKADVAEHPQVFDHVGLLVNEPSSDGGVPFI
jgi:hypothetical protein